MKAEQVHHKLYNQAIEAVKTGQDLPAQNVYLCTVCGHIEMGSAPDLCEICKAGKDKFILVS